MIKIENVEVTGFEHAIRGMRNPKNSWGKSDSGYCGGDDHIGCANCACLGDRDKNQKMIEVDLKHGYDVKPCGKKEFDNSFCVGYNDHDLMMRLANGGPVHAKYRRMIVVYLDITSHHAFWSEFDTYKVGTVRNSCSKMHKIHVKAFVKDDFSHEGIDEVGEYAVEAFEDLLITLERLRIDFNRTQEKKYWRAMIELLPMGYNIKATIMLNYEVLVGMYRDRKKHKLDEWRELCKWIESLPYSELITGENKESEE